ncbi:MAG TPA: hypothetical protein ACFYD6_13400 [Candidatus Brocadiia bacterium]|nr:hypothetical protein [Candidatus Brocadiales bacterium]
MLDSEMVLNDAGQLVELTWNDLSNRFSFVQLDEFVIMPNHIHGIIVIVGAGLSALGGPDNKGAVRLRRTFLHWVILRGHLIQFRE